MKKNKEKVKEILISLNIGLNFLDDNYLIPFGDLNSEFVEKINKIFDLILEDCKDGLVIYSYYRNKYIRLKLVPKITEEDVKKNQMTLLPMDELKQNLLYASSNPSYNLKFQFIKNIVLPILISYLYPCKKYLPILKNTWGKIKHFFNFFKYKKELKRQKNILFDYLKEAGN